ncbi:MAG: Gfo/Idh/MocA family protein [Candidatus Hermodarchaeota archaeon]
MVIGTGYWGKNHVRNYKELLMENRIDYLKLYDTNESRVKQMANDYSLEYFKDFEDIISDEKISAVVIVTPSSTHYDLAKKFLENGKDVFIEKPMTLNSNEAKELFEISEKNNRILMVGHLFRYHPAVKDLKKRIDIGEFGKINMIITYRFAFGIPRKDMGVVYALAVHELDLSCYLLDQKLPVSVLADITSYHQNSVEEMANISMDFSDGAKSYMMESWNIPVYGKKREIIVIGSEKSAIINYLLPNEYNIFDTKIKTQIIDGQSILELEDNAVNKIIIDYKEPLKEEILHFLDCLKSRNKPETDGFIGYKAVQMCEAVFQSARENKRIYL